MLFGTKQSYKPGNVTNCLCFLILNDKIVVTSYSCLQVAEYLVPNVRSVAGSGSTKPTYVRFLTGLKAYTQIFSVSPTKLRFLLCFQISNSLIAIFFCWNELFISGSLCRELCLVLGGIDLWLKIEKFAVCSFYEYYDISRTYSTVPPLLKLSLWLCEGIWQILYYFIQ